MPLGRTIAGDPIVVFRGSDGLVALEDMCPHRFVPLSRGTVTDGVLECAYHGLRFGAEGRCVFNPLGAPPEGARVRVYPVIELHAAIWVWLGDPDRADAALIPDFSFLTDPARATVTGYTYARADYQLAIDNLTDLTHVQFVHRDFQASEAYPRLEHRTWQDGDDVYRAITFPDGRPAPFIAGAMDPQKHIDITMETRWSAPSLVKLTASVTEPGRPDQYLFGNFSAHLVTPEQPGTCHYFYAHSRDYGVDDPATDQRVREWQQARVANRDLMKMRPVILPTDAGGVRARRILAKRIMEEMRGVAAEPTPEPAQ
jgi:phenylpropionate dioxygenase-like ring-hydroxylating dioxygenase large terminal subunit